MKKFVSLLLVLVLLVTLTGCGSKDNKETKDNDVYTFKYEDMTIPLGEEFSRTKYGEELEYSETPTCAFEDMDRTYTYEHYSISTYTLDKQEKVLSIYFLDTDVKTPEGISLGDSFDKVKDTYGKKYKKDDNLYKYTKGKTNLEFIIENDAVTSIEYTYDAES